MGKYRNTRSQANLRLNAVFLHRDERGLQVLIEPVRERRRSGQQKNRRRQQPRFHFAVNFRP